MLANLNNYCCVLLLTALSHFANLITPNVGSATDTASFQCHLWPQLQLFCRHYRLILTAAVFLVENVLY